MKDELELTVTRPLRPIAKPELNLSEVIEELPAKADELNADKTFNAKDEQGNGGVAAA